MKRFTVAGILLGLLALSASAQSWVESFGTDTRYKPPLYISGYGVSDRADPAERLEAARSSALSQLSRQVRVQVTSDESIRTSDYGNGQRNRYTNTVQTVSDLKISGANFEIEERRRQTHVLAWIEIRTLKQQFEAQRGDARSRISQLLERFDRSIERGDYRQAQRDLATVDTAFAELTDAVTVIRALDTLSGRPAAVSGGDGGAQTVNLQEDLEARRDRLRGFQPETPRQAADYLARLLAEDLGTVERVTPLLYERADFSSQFGSRFAGLLEAALQRTGGAGDADPVVVRGSYWPEDDTVELHVVARDIETGRTVSAAQVSIPASSVARGDLEPANMDEALAGGTALLNDQIVNGGLDLEVWTDKGRDERALVFEEDEYVQFYFRVNQPAFLRLSYVLASGETVLLEERFYIGIDRVNRVVALPDRFQVVPPFGVERLVVTGHTSEPPPAEVYPKVIDGQEYQVFGSPREAVVRTRGLVKADPPEEAGDTRVAEASLSITTVGRE